MALDLAERYPEGQRTARVLRDFALVRVVLWSALLPYAFLGPGHLAASVPFVVFLSLASLVLTDLSVYQGGRAEVQAGATEAEGA